MVVQGTSENLQRVYRKHKIATTFKPHITLTKSLVHPKTNVTRLKLQAVFMN